MAISTGAAILGGAAMSFLGSRSASKDQAAATRDAAAMADPFSGQRGFYQGMLRSIYGGGAGGAAPTGGGGVMGGLMSSFAQPAAGVGGGGFDIGGFIRSNPAYQFSYDEAMRGVERSSAAKGMFGSGNLYAALQERGGGIASQTYDKEIGRIMTMAGANIGSPGAAGQIYSGGMGGAIGYEQQALGGIGYGLTRFGMDQGWIGGGGGGGSAPPPPIWV